MALISRVEGANIFQHHQTTTKKKCLAASYFQKQGIAAVRDNQQVHSIIQRNPAAYFRNSVFQKISSVIQQLHPPRQTFTTH